MFVPETTGRPGHIVPGLLAAVAAMLVMGHVGHHVPAQHDTGDHPEPPAIDDESHPLE